jgi:hypothetical protein
MINPRRLPTSSLLQADGIFLQVHVQISVSSLYVTLLYSGTPQVLLENRCQAEPLPVLVSLWRKDRPQSLSALSEGPLVGAVAFLWQSSP